MTRNRRRILLSFPALLLLGLQSDPATAQTAAAGPLELTHGIASGDITASSAILWSRSNRAATMRVEVDALASFATPLTIAAQSTVAADFTAQVKVVGLESDTSYHYRVWFDDDEGSRSAVEVGRFRTTPEAGASRDLRFVFSGDLGGQRYCRRVGVGYGIFARMRELEPDFFVANGDMIYADNDCPEQGPGDWRNTPGDFPGVGAQQVDWNDYEGLRAVFLAHWRYNRADEHFLSFTKEVPMYVQWDDHEVINDFGAAWPAWTRVGDREGYTNLVRAGLMSFFDFHPMSRHPEDPFRIYRTFSWGREMELIILDARSYRSLNSLPDDRDSAKTMLGEPQLDWLQRVLQASSSTWKIISSDVPLSVPTGTNSELYGSDAWADGNRDAFSAASGFESELQQILHFLDEHDIKNVVFITTDVHFAAQLRYQLDADGDGDEILFHELIAGPLNAVRAPTPAQLDSSLHPVFLYGEGDIFNFAFVRIERQADGLFHLRADVRDERGVIRPGSELDLTPQ